MKEIYLTWLDDKPGFIKSLEEKIELVELDNNVKFIIDEHHDSKNFDSIARNIVDDLVFLIDYNLKGIDGSGLDGDEVIKLIRNHNNSCLIIFYSANANQEDLRKLIDGIDGVIIISRENLMDELIKLC